MLIKEFVVWSREGEKLRADIRYTQTGIEKPLILFMHGLNGFKNWGSFPYIFEQLARNGFVVVAFNFSGSGIGDDLQTFTHLDKYAHNTVTREIEEAVDMIEAIVSLNDLPIPANEVAINRLGILGHSLGAGIATIIGSKFKIIKAIALWSPVCTFDRFSDRQKEDWKKRGYFERENSRTGQMMRLNIELLLDIEQHSLSQSILTAAQELNRPMLIVAGAEDLTVPINESQAIHRTVGGSELHVIRNTGHTFGAEHPFQGPTKGLDEALNLTISFFKDNL